MEVFYNFLTLPPLCKGRWRFRQKTSEGLALLFFVKACFLIRLFTIPQSPPLTAPFTQGSLFKSLLQRIAKQFISRLLQQAFHAQRAFHESASFHFTYNSPYIRRLRVANHSQYSSSELLSIFIIPLSPTICNCFYRVFGKNFQIPRTL